jgi:hypothetical protein
LLLFTGAKRKERAFETERLSVSLPAHLVRTSFPESEVLESLLKANADLDHRMSKSLQTWGSYFRRESSSSLFAAPRTLRISVYNLHHRQDGRYRGAPGGPDEPSWTLRIEGKLLGDAKDAKSAKFSQFVKSISIEIPAVASRSEKRLVEWSNSSAVDSDGFELVVAGQSEVKVKILMVISYPMQLYMLAPPLAKLLGVEVETHEQVLRGVWIYCQKQNLATE